MEEEKLSKLENDTRYTKDELIVMLAEKIYKAEQKCHWKLERLKDEHDENEVAYELFGDYNYWSYQTIDQLEHYALKTSVEELAKIIQNVWNRLTENDAQFDDIIRGVCTCGRMVIKPSYWYALSNEEQVYHNTCLTMWEKQSGNYRQIGDY
jgi:hypothetical protein